MLQAMHLLFPLLMARIPSARHFLTVCYPVWILPAALHPFVCCPVLRHLSEYYLLCRLLYRLFRFHPAPAPLRHPVPDKTRFDSSHRLMDMPALLLQESYLNSAHPLGIMFSYHNIKHMGLPLPGFHILSAHISTDHQCSLHSRKVHNLRSLPKVLSKDGSRQVLRSVHC